MERRTFCVGGVCGFPCFALARRVLCGAKHGENENQKEKQTMRKLRKESVSEIIVDWALNASVLLAFVTILISR